MNECADCGCFFDDDEADLVPEINGDGDNHWKELYPRCPYCGSEDFNTIIIKEENEND